MAAEGSVSEAQSSLRMMREEVGALGRSERGLVDDSTLRTQATTMLLARWRNAATRPFPIPVGVWSKV